MAIDVLRYNSLNKANKSTFDSLTSSISTLNSNIQTQNTLCLQAQSGQDPVTIGNAGPNQANLWCAIPTLPATGCAWTTGFKVCNIADTYFRCGASCSWTVPGGVTCARFQIWGAGAGTGYGCCCAFTPFGGTGAYASVIIPVTAGSIYTLCAGCALCCCATAGGTNTAAGCASYVTGAGLTNFCAEGGEGSLYCQLTTRCQCGAVLGYCGFLGGCICSNNSVCWWISTPGTGGPTCCFDNMLPMISSCKTFFGSATSGTVFGIRGSFGAIAVNCNGTPIVQHPPIYGFPTTSCCCCIFTTNSVSGWCRAACTGALQIPGAGGYALFQCAGSNSEAGDSGRFGMVCVSYL